jgi:hypothetical protein
MCAAIPQRGRLLDKITRVVGLDICSMQDAIQDLHTLCGVQLSPFYLPGTEPYDDNCPVPTCREPLESKRKDQRCDHVIQCRRWYIAHEMQGLRKDVHYCRVCFGFVWEDWEQHCSTHIANWTSLKCSALNVSHSGPTGSVSFLSGQ